MFLKLNHQNLNVYSSSRRLLVKCYKLVKYFPEIERYGMSSQIRRAAISIHLNLSEGASRKSIVERKRFYEISRGSLIEIDGALDAASDLGYLEHYDTEALGVALVRTFSLLAGMIKAE